MLKLVCHSLSVCNIKLHTTNLLQLCRGPVSHNYNDNNGGDDNDSDNNDNNNK